MQGLLHIYCGDGKGKTTAAMGLALRCAGYDNNVLVAQFMKQANSGERLILQNVPNVTLWQTYPAAKFSFHMNAEEKMAAAAWYSTEFQKIVETVQNQPIRLLILDEVISCVRCGFLPEQKLLEFLDTRPLSLEVVLTGRNPTEAMQKRADYVTEMRKQKHPYEKGISARQGIEF